ncbi:MAG: hypothetical protein M0T79_10250 [Actinomycetota bacterium]|jgi:hypothetical protein|nr:hypothetical protein [Actinomycetota bacterium]
MDALTISCDECQLDGTSACDDCVVSFIDDLHRGSEWDPERPSRASTGAVIVDAAEARAMRLLHSAGLVPDLRFERRVC